MLVERIIKLSTIASKDATRYYLNGVWLSCEKGKLLIEVTDGHKASREFLSMEDCPQFEGHFFVDSDKIPLLKVINKQNKYIPCPVSYDVEADLLSFGMNSEVVLKRSQHKPPPFKQIYVKHNENELLYDKNGNEVNTTLNDEPLKAHIVIGLNAKYLLEIAEALKDDKKVSHVKLIIKDKISPITVVVGNRDAVLMPCRV